MRTHADMIRDAGGAHKVRIRLGYAPHQFETVKSWLVRDRIPVEHWTAVVATGLCTLEELAAAAAARQKAA